MRNIRILFVHHSIGRYCLQAGLRPHIARTMANIELWDIDYRRFGVHDGNGKAATAPTLTVPNDNTNPDGLHDFVAEFLKEGSRGQPTASMFDGIVLKSCYTGARIRSDECLKTFMDSGRKTLQMLEQRKCPALILTPVPDSPFYSSSKTASRAVEYAQFLSVEAAHNNAVHVVNLHIHLADERGFLRSEFRKLGGLDPHPNLAGLNAIIDLIHHGLESVFKMERASASL